MINNIFNDIKNHNENNIKKYINSNGNLEIKNSEGYTPLMAAAKNDDMKTVNMLLKKGSNIFAKDNNGHEILDIIPKNKNMYFYLQEIIILSQMYKCDIRNINSLKNKIGYNSIIKLHEKFNNTKGDLILFSRLMRNTDEIIYRGKYKNESISLCIINVFDDQHNYCGGSLKVYYKRNLNEQEYHLVKDVLMTVETQIIGKEAPYYLVLKHL